MSYSAIQFNVKIHMQTVGTKDGMFCFFAFFSYFFSHFSPCIIIMILVIMQMKNTVNTDKRSLIRFCNAYI